MTYATSDEVRLAEMLGYGWNCNRQRGHIFQRGRRHVWASSRYVDPTVEKAPIHEQVTAYRVPCWQTADLGPDGFTNHQHFDDLKEALRRP